MSTTDPPPEPTERPDYDWVHAKRLFVEGLPTEDADARDDRLKFVNLRQLAEHLDYSYDAVRRHAAAEDWSTARAEFIGNVERARQAERTANLARQAVDLDARALRVSAVGLGLVQRAAGQMAQRALDAQQEHGEAAAAATIDPGELATLALAARRWHEVGLRAVGKDGRHVIHTGPDGAQLPDGGTTNVLVVPRGDDERMSRVAGLLSDAGALILAGAPIPGMNGNGSNGHALELEEGGQDWYAGLADGLEDADELEEPGEGPIDELDPDE